MRRRMKSQSKRLWSYLKDYKFNSLLIRNFILIAVLASLPVYLLSLFYNDHSRKIIQTEISQANLNSLYRSADMVETLMKDMQGFTYDLSVNQNTVMFGYWGRDELIGSELISDLLKDLKFYKLMFEYIDSIYLYSEKTGLVIYNDNLTDKYNMPDKTWLSIYEAMGDNSFIMESRRKNDFYPYYISFIYPIRFAREASGAVVVNINIEKLGQLIGSNKNVSQDLFIVDEDMRLYYSSDYALIGSQDYAPDYLSFVKDRAGDFSGTFTINGQETIVSRVESQRYSLSYILLSPVGLYEDRINTFQAFMNRITLLTLLISLAVSYFLTLKSFQPVRRIIEAVENPSPLDKSYLPQHHQSNEVVYVTELVRKNHEQNSRLKLELEERMDKLNNAQLFALQNQIDPHFLYNTLDTINWMAIEKDGTGNPVSVMISSLAQLLRISLKRTSYLVTVGEEMEHAKLYLKILELRYKDKLQVYWEISEEIVNFKIVKFSIQPLVENALNHGLRTRRFEGHIHIKGTLIDNTVVISVEDNGIGMNDIQRMEFNRHLKTDYQFDDRHVGIRNVNQRIKLLFGEKYGVVLAPQSSNGGLVVTVVFPRFTEES